MSGPYEAISSFLDGEPCEPSEVLSALETDVGRAALVDFVRLRVVTARPVMPGDAFYARWNDHMQLAAARHQRRSRWPVAAALAASLIIGFWSGSRMANRPIENVPPKADRVVEFENGVDWHQPVTVESQP
jgi:hypothetical protein